VKSFGEEERGEIAVVFDAGVIIGLFRGDREEDTHVDRLYETVVKLISTIGREIGGRVAMSVDQEMVNVICRKLGMSKEEIEKFGGLIKYLRRLTRYNKQIAILRTYGSGDIESKLNKSTKVRDMG
jgi:predicted nucleic acid-binding protein